MLFVIVLAQIDLSVGSVVAVTGALSGVSSSSRATPGGLASSPPSSWVS